MKVMTSKQRRKWDQMVQNSELNKARRAAQQRAKERKQDAWIMIALVVAFLTLVTLEAFQ